MKSIYKLAAESGVPVGLYFITAATCFFLSLRIPSLEYLVFPMMLVFPAVLYLLMKRMVKTEPGYCRFSPMWLYGIYTVIFGSLICMLYATLFLMFIEPHFLLDYANAMIATLQEQPSPERFEATVDVLRNAIDSHMLPSVTDFVTTIGWLTCFTGSMLSMVLALILTRMSKRRSVSMFR